MSVRARMIKGLTAYSYGRLVIVAGQILAVPLLVTRWGAAGYGEWVTLTALASYISYANVGVPGAVRADLALAYGDGGHARMRESFQTCLLLMSATGFIAMAGFIGLINLAPLGWIVRGSALSPQDAAFIAGVFAVQMLLLLVLGVFQAALSAVGRYGYVGFLESNRQAAEFIGLLVIVGGLHKGPAIACMIYPATMALHLGVLIGRVQADAPWVLEGPWRFHRSAMQRLFKPMLGVLATSFGYYGLSFQAPRVILGLVAGPTAVAVYAVTAMLMRVIRMPIDIVAHSPSVELSLAYGAGERQRARNILSGAMRSCLWIALFMVPFILLFGPFVVDVWTRHRVQVPMSLLIFTSLSTVVFSLTLPAQEALMSLGQLGKATFWLVAVSVPMLLLELGLIRLFGLPGAGAAVVVLDIFYAGLALLWTVRLFGFDGRAFAASLLKPPFEIVGTEAGHLRRMLHRRFAS